MLNHCKSAKHLENKKRYAVRMSPYEIMKKFVVQGREEKKKENIGVLLTEEDELSRLLLTQALLNDCIPFQVCRSSSPFGLKSYIQGLAAGLSCTADRPLRDLIPTILKVELATLQKEIRLQDTFSVIFDSTPYIAEVLGVVIRYVDSNLDIQHRCVEFKFYDVGSFSASELGSCVSVSSFILITRTT